MAASTPARRINKLFDPLTALLSDVTASLDTGVLRSTEIVELYIAQIEKHNSYLRAVATLAPRSQLREYAEARDQERARGFVRGPLHGVPVLIKVCQSNLEVRTKWP